MIKKIIITTISIFFCFILQSSVFSRLNIGKTIPNLLIILTACVGFMEGDMFGLITGFVCGMLMDVFFSPFNGFYAVIYMYIGYFNGKFCNIFYPEDVKLPVGLIITSDLMYGLSCYVFLFLLRGRFDFSYYLGNVIFPEVIATVIVTLCMYPIILTVHNRLSAIKRV